MKPTGEPNLRRIDERLLAARQRAAVWVGQWTHENGVIRAGDTEICEVAPALAQHIADCHNHFLPLTNQLLYRERSEEDLDAKPSLAAREIPRIARARRFPIPPSRPRPAGTP